jgi:hypothetical protein
MLPKPSLVEDGVDRSFASENANIFERVFARFAHHAHECARTAAGIATPTLWNPPLPVRVAIVSLLRI